MQLDCIAGDADRTWNDYPPSRSNKEKQSTADDAGGNYSNDYFELSSMRPVGILPQDALVSHRSHLEATDQPEAAAGICQ